MKLPIRVEVDGMWAGIVDADDRVVVPPITNFEKDAVSICLRVNSTRDLTDTQIIVNEIRRKENV